MHCRVDGCGRAARYKAAQLCQKHYFRVRRNGIIETLPVPEKKKRHEWDSRGYQRVLDPSHPLADSKGYVAEHRKMVYAALNGEVRACEMCGKEITWKTTHVDHVDHNPRNNALENLRALCRSCNCRRDRRPEYFNRNATAIMFDGKVDTPTGWARDPRARFCGNQIRARIKAGMSAREAIMGEKKTHKNIQKSVKSC